MCDKRNWPAYSPVGADREGEFDNVKRGLQWRPWRLLSMGGQEVTLPFRTPPSLMISLQAPPD